MIHCGSKNYFKINLLSLDRLIHSLTSTNERAWPQRDVIKISAILRNYSVTISETFKGFFPGTAEA